MTRGARHTLMRAHRKGRDYLTATKEVLNAGILPAKQTQMLWQTRCEVEARQAEIDAEIRKSFREDG